MGAKADTDEVAWLERAGEQGEQIGGRGLSWAAALLLGSWFPYRNEGLAWHVF